ncbi:dihydroorotase [Marinospirillum insulare]|uniref:Dihydroorotase-like protein n=1 Tax=Marinospirillum insulare TaxID=217169 RepID=A0ABQ5ZZZ4_9GAMM|nr:dihydroorotase [Marinospirillum insulare]GLR64883.1 dihydroorotase-like protein [Marinospirillum insulare]
MNISILGGRVVDPAQVLDQIIDLHIQDGKILALGDCPAGFQAEQTLNAEGLIVCPGFIDLGSHLREPGPSYKGNIASETQAALAGGFTQVCARPDTQPPLDSPAVVRVVRERAELAGKAKVLPLGALTQGLEGQLLSNMSGLQAAGCVALTNLRRPVQDNLILRRCLEYAATFDLLVIFYPEDNALKGSGFAHEGSLSSQLGLDGIPETAETLAVAQTLLLVEQTGIRAHFAHLSTARAVTQIAEAKAKGLPVTADVALSHLLFTEASLESFDSNFHLEPPLRSEADRLGLLQGLKDGTISAVSSGHLPHEAAAKKAPFAASEPGMSCLEVVLPQMLALVESGWLNLGDLVKRLALAPAKLLGIESGALWPGYSADITLIDPEASWLLNEQTGFSAGQNTPFWNQPLKGRVVTSLVDGEIRFNLK